MHACSVVLVVFSHLLVSMHSDTGASFSSEAMLRCWLLFTVLTIGPHLLSTRAACWEQRCVRMSHAVLVLCASVVVNAAVSALASAPLSYCYLLHSACAFALHLAADDMVSLCGRTVMVFTAAVVLLAVHIFPVPLPVAAMRSVDATQGMSFESAHLWAFVCVILTRGATDTVALLATRL
jgi:hypothetical protein